MLSGCPSATCPDGYVLDAMGRCVVVGDTGPTNDAAMRGQDAGPDVAVFRDAAVDASVAVDGCVEAVDPATFSFSTAGTYQGTELVQTASGYMLFAVAASGQVWMQAVDVAGTPMGAAQGTTLTADGLASISAANAGADFALAYVDTAGAASLARIRVDGTVAAGPFAMQAGAFFRLRISQADASRATVYVAHHNGSAVDLSRFRIDYSTSTVSMVTPRLRVAGGALTAGVAFDVIHTPINDYVVYSDDGSGTLGAGIWLAVADSGDAHVGTGPYFSLRTSSQEPNVYGIALALADDTAAVSASNPLAVAWQADSSTRFTEVSALTSAGAGPIGAVVSLSGSTGYPTMGWVLGDTLRALPLASSTSGTASGHWLVTADDDASGGDALMTWEVLGHVGSPTSSALAVGSPLMAEGGTALAPATRGALLSLLDPNRNVVTRFIGCH
jgi:hypothetical protein